MDFGLGSTARSWDAVLTARTKLGRSGSRWVTRKDEGGSGGRKRDVILLM